MNDTKIHTLHPDPTKEGVNIERAKYDTIRAAILDALERCGPIPYSDLTADIDRQLAGNFDGSINWYTVTVKLDLEARGVIERVPKTKPEQIRITQS